MYFRNKSHKNPENLRNRCDFCEHPQPRYKPHPNINDILPEFKYLLHKQCLPGCFAVQSNTTTETNNGNLMVNVVVTDDIQCEDYNRRVVDGKSNSLKATRKTFGDFTGTLFELGKQSQRRLVHPVNLLRIIRIIHVETSLLYCILVTYKKVHV